MNDNRKVQELTISLLKEFMEICREEGLRYYFTGGSLIGIMRHQGFIPWDDDVDIGMPRKDYQRFLQVMAEKKKPGYGICNRFTDPNWHFAMSQFIDEESVIQIDLAEQPRQAHVWVDVFPLDGLPNNRLHRWLRVRHILLLRYMVQTAHIKTQVDSHRSRPLAERLVLGFLKAVPLGKLINTRKTLDRLEKVLQKSDFDSSAYVGNMLGRYREREVVPREFFGEATEMAFEGVPVKVPAQSHALLTALYGDYMQLPPEKDRVGHNVKILHCRALEDKR